MKVQNLNLDFHFVQCTLLHMARWEKLHMKHDKICEATHEKMEGGHMRRKK